MMMKVWRFGRRHAVRFTGAVALMVPAAGWLSAGPAAAAAHAGFSMPKFTPTAPPDTGGLSSAFGWLQWGGLAVCVAGVMVAGARMAIANHNGRGGEHGSAVAYALGGAILIGAASGLIGALGS